MTACPRLRRPLCVIVACEKSAKLCLISSSHVPAERVAKRPDREYLPRRFLAQQSPGKEFSAPSPKISYGGVHSTRRKRDRPVDVRSLYLLAVFEDVRSGQLRHNRAWSADACIRQAGASGEPPKSIRVRLAGYLFVKRT